MAQDQEKKPVVMQVLPALQSGGVERGTVDIAKALKKEGFEPIVVSAGGLLVYQLKEAGIKHITLSVDSKNPFTILRNRTKIKKIIQEHQVDLVHVRSRAPMWSIYPICQTLGIKLVSTVHGTYGVKGLFKKSYNAAMLKADRIIVASEFIKNYLIENYHQKVKWEFLDKVDVIARGVDLHSFDVSKISQSRIVDLITKWNLPDDKKVIMLPARFTAWKGHEFLIDALAQVKSDFFCIFVGSDHGHEEYRKKIEQKVKKVGLQGKVKVVGVCKDMSVAYAIVNIVISASVRPEAFGRVAIESQAMKRVTIATNIGGSLETIIDGKTGFLANANDSAHMAQLIDQALNLSDEEVFKIGEAARKNIEDNFSNQQMCDQTLNVYRKLLC